jgi:hypothetical protein
VMVPAGDQVGPRAGLLVCGQASLADSLFFENATAHQQPNLLSREGAVLAQPHRHHNVEERAIDFEHPGTELVNQLEENLVLG